MKSRERERDVNINKKSEILQPLMFHTRLWISKVTSTEETNQLIFCNAASFTLFYACNSKNQIKYFIYSISKNCPIIIIKRPGTWNVVDSLFVGAQCCVYELHPHKLCVGALIPTRLTYTGRRLATEPVILLLPIRIKKQDDSTINVGSESILII